MSNMNRNIGRRAATWASCVVLMIPAMTACEKTSPSNVRTAQSPAPAAQPSCDASPSATNQKWNIVDLTLGMSPDQIQAVLSCSKTKFHFSEEKRRRWHSDKDFEVDDPVSGAKPVRMLTAQTDICEDQGICMTVGDPKKGAKISAYFLGMAGHEKAVKIDRTVYFGDPSKPAPDSVQTELINKYGAPALQTENGRDRMLTWQVAPNKACEVPAGYLSSVSLKASCGIGLYAKIEIDENGNASEVDQTLIDQAAALQQRAADRLQVQALAKTNGSVPSF